MPRSLIFDIVGQNWVKATFFASFNSICSSRTFCISICQVSSCWPNFTFWFITYKINYSYESGEQVTTALTSRSCWLVWISSPLVSDNCIHASFFSLMAIFLSLKHMFMVTGWVELIDLKCYSSLRPALAMREEEASLGWASLLGYY